MMATGEVRGIRWVRQAGRLRVDGMADRRGHGDRRPRKLRTVGSLLVDPAAEVPDGTVLVMISAADLA